MPTREELKTSLISFSQRAIQIKDHLKNEEATKVSLVLPFIELLGYDIRNPMEVSPEHSADFSEKFKNRVDYAILKDGVPAIAIECKSVGASKKDDRGQLKSYFNAAKTIKLGILTDGIKYEFFVDSFAPNLMDDEPFLSVDCAAISSGRLTETTVDGVMGLLKATFDPAKIADSAQQNIVYRAFYDYISVQYNDPSVSFTRLLLTENEIKHVRASAIDWYRDIARKAFHDVFNSQVLKRLEISAPAQTKVPATQSAQVAGEPRPTNSSALPEGDGIVTTEVELEAFEAVRRRLAFLCSGDNILFEKIKDVRYRDYQSRFIIYIGGERKGRLVEITEARDNALRYAVADGLPDNEASSLEVLDARLLAQFRKVVVGLER